MLEHEHLVGRSPHANLQIKESYVSSQHATLRWVRDAWQVRDLGSRNGTLLDGEALAPGGTWPIKKGTRITFGRPEQQWELVDDAPPSPSLIPNDDASRAVMVDSDVVAIPTSDQPLATVFRAKDGGWKLEREDEVLPLVAGSVFELEGERWRFSAPLQVSDTSKADWPQLMAQRLGGASLTFRVSSDEEHVEMVLKNGAESFDLGGRTYNYLLLCLARQRLTDEQAGVKREAAGWVYRDDLLEALKMDREHLNIAIFRIRKQFERTGLKDAASIIERRPNVQQLRIGVAKLEVHGI